jgi:hypothetical protein
MSGRRSRWPERALGTRADGSSGDGFQQCHAAGRYIDGLILGQPPALDLSVCSPERILENKPLSETALKLI